MVQERLKDNEQIHRSNAPSALKELAGLIRCKECAYAVKAYGINHKTEHISLARYGRAALKACDVSFKGVRLVDIQNKVGNEIQKKLDEIAIEILTDMSNSKVKENKISELNDKIDNLLEIAALGSQTAKEVHNKIEKLEAEIKQIQLDYALLGTP